MSPLLLLLACNPEPADSGVATFETVALAEALAEQETADHAAENLSWDWVQTVWGYGIHRLFTATGEDRWQDYYRSWMDEALAEAEAGDPPDVDSSDSVAPTILAAVLEKERSDLAYAPLIETADTYLEEQAPRTDGGAICHWGEDNTWGMPTDQVWVDSQFMFGVYLLQRYAGTGDRTWLETWWEQYRLFEDLCRDPDDLLYRHAYDAAEDDNIPEEAVYWARGNAWVLISAAEALALMGPEDALWEEVQPRFQAHAEAVLALQETDDGLWHTVLNEPEGDDSDNYTETSASALFGYAWVRGLQAGALEGDTWTASLEGLVEGLQDRVDREEDGVYELEGTSAGTNPGDYDYYTSVAQVDDLMLGYGSVVLLLAEVDGLPRLP